jgi:TonB family protein
MRQVTAYLLLFFLCFNHLFSQKSSTVAFPKTLLSKNPLTDAKAFFQYFTMLKENPHRGEFETEFEFQKRIFKKIDTSTIFLFSVSEPASNQNKNYVYNIESNILTISGGKLQTYESDTCKVDDAIPIIIQVADEDQGSYKASNAFGSVVIVHSTYTYNYIINFTNLDFLPDSLFDRKNHTFHYSIYRLPKEAERLSKALTIIVGVKPVSYQRSNYECIYSSQPKINYPYKRAIFNYSFDARLVRLSLYNKLTKKFLINYYVREDSSIIFQRINSAINKGEDTDLDDIPPPEFLNYDKEPTVIKRVEPTYPDLAKSAGLEGNVFLKVWVDRKGKARKVVILKSDDKIFEQAAEDAAKQWEFQPAYSHNKPVSVWVSIPFRFRLSGNK